MWSAMPCARPAFSDMQRSLAIALTLFLAACSIPPPEDSPRVAYRAAESVKSLSVPPDLSRPQSSEALDVSERGVGVAGVLPEYDDIRMVRAGPLQWLEVTGASPEDLWPRMSGFLRSEGLTIREQRPGEGLIETAWATRFDAVPRGGIGGALENLFGGVVSDQIRDKYQIRLERMDGTEGTRIFLSHWAAQAVNTNPVNLDSPDIDMVRQQPDPAVAAEMRRRLLVYLGVSRDRASAIAGRDGGQRVYTAPIRLVETKGGEVYADLQETSYRRALGLVGEALRLVGAEVTEIEEDKGEIWVRWLPPKEIRGRGLFSDDRPKRLLVKLLVREDSVQVRAGDRNGNLRSGEIQVALLERTVDAMGGDVSSYRGVEVPEEEPAGSATPGPDY